MTVGAGLNPQHLQQPLYYRRIDSAVSYTSIKGEVLQPLQALSNPKTAKTEKLWVALVGAVPHRQSVKCIILIAIFSLCLPFAYADNVVLGDLIDIPNLSPEAQFCQLGKPKKGRFTDIEKCQKGDVLYYDNVVKTENVGHMIRICEWGTFQQPQVSVVKLGAYAETYAICIYSGAEMRTR